MNFLGNKVNLTAKGGQGAVDQIEIFINFRTLLDGFFILKIQRH